MKSIIEENVLILGAMKGIHTTTKVIFTLFDDYANGVPFLNQKLLI